jgi:carbon monoxide dehydrogenase subunit G
MLTDLLTRPAERHRDQSYRLGRHCGIRPADRPYSCAAAALGDEAGSNYSRGWALGVRKERLVASFENTVLIRRPIEEVFGFLSDFENVPKWNYAIVQTRKVSQGPVGVGTIYQQVRSVPSRSEERFEVTAYNPPRQLEIQGQLGPFPSRLAYALDAVPEGTRVTNAVELELRGPGRVLGRVAVPRVRDAVAANLSKLKELLER